MEWWNGIEWWNGMEWNKCYSNILQLSGWHQCQPRSFVIEIIEEYGSVTSSWDPVRMAREAIPPQNLIKFAITITVQF